MNLQVFALLVQDGLTNGAVYALLAFAIVLVFAVTRVIWVPCGELVAYAALTLAALQRGSAAGMAGVLVGLAIAAGVVEAAACLRRGAPRELPRRLALWSGVPLAIAGGCVWLGGLTPPFGIQIAMTLLLVTAMGPLVYRIAYQPILDAPVLVLLIVSVAIHYVLMGLGLYFFGAEGVRTPAFSGLSFGIGGVTASLQSLLVAITSIVLIGAFYLFFGRTLHGKALRATALNRVGARLVGISPSLAGTVAFTLGSLLCAFAGVLIGPFTTLYYDSGFLVSLKAFVGAIIGGLASYPVAAAGALLVGQIESFASFFSSGFKEVIVFTLIIPVLLWRSLTTHHHEEEE